MLMNLSDVKSTMCVTIRRQRLLLTSGFLRDLLRHQSILEAIRQDAVIGRLWLVIEVK